MRAVIGALLFSVLVLSQAPEYSQAQAAPSRVPVLVELFTSEGCSTCPPAEDLLADLLHRQAIPGVQLIGLAEHVDYWDRLGWKDRFSSNVFTQRQAVYAKNLNVAEPYTPQLIVDGEKQVLGSDKSAVLHAVRDAARLPSATLTIGHLDVRGKSVTFSVALSNAPAGTSGDMLAAIVDDSDTTVVTNGENGGQTVRDTAAVRTMKYFGQLAAGESKVVVLDLPPGAAPGKSHVVVFVQAAKQGRVIAASSAPV
jgi:hypothetical protein